MSTNAAEVDLKAMIVERFNAHMRDFRGWGMGVTAEKSAEHSRGLQLAAAQHQGACMALRHLYQDLFREPIPVEGVPQPRVRIIAP